MKWRENDKPHRFLLFPKYFQNDLLPKRSLLYDFVRRLFTVLFPIHQYVADSYT